MTVEFRVGQQVKIVRAFLPDDFIYWDKEMNDTIGKEGVILSTDYPGYCSVHFSYQVRNWWYPYSSLEHVCVSPGHGPGNAHITQEFPL